MARKLYIFGVGGTGSRVIKSMAMLLAAGVKLENEFDTVVPIIIDPDTDNGDLDRTKNILKLYQEVRNQIKEPYDFFKQELKTVNELADPQNRTISPEYFQFKLNDVDSSSFSQYIGFDSLSEDYKNSKDDKSFVKQLYSNSNLNSNLKIGFKGNPNMGSIVLNQFTNSKDFERFGQTFKTGDAIFIINSIFGGTGAAGFPLLLKNLRGNENLLNHAQIKNAPIGGITYLPYFTLDQQGEINAESFEEKAKIAIDYYNRTIINQRKINVLHFIGNRGNTNIEKYAVGGTEQKNKAHFLEIAGALAIVEFCKNITNYKCEDGQTTEETKIKEFGIEHDNENIAFGDLNIKNKETLFKPLTKFRLFTQYLNEGLERAKDVSRWTKSNIKFVSNQKQSPCDSVYFKSTEYNNQVVTFNNHFRDWIDELSKNKPAFNPFEAIIPLHFFKKLDTQNCLHIDNLKIRSEKDKKTGELKQIHTTLIRLFGISTSKIYNKFPIRVNDNEGKGIKVFRLHTGQGESGWFNSKTITNDDLSTIITEGKDVASSIPSPFARIDLVKSAFAWLNYKVSSIVGGRTELTPEDKLKIREIIEGKTAQNKLISDALDIAQLFYKYPTIKDKIEIFAWKPNDRFQELIENSFDNVRHSIFADTLKIYWEQDSIKTADRGRIPALYNFEHTNRLFFVINKSTKQVLGGTSPATLFFAAPDAREAIKKLDIKCGQDILLDDIYFPLHKREVSFIEYLYAFARQSNRFSGYFPEVNTYLENIKNYLLDDSIRTVVANLTNNSINSYSQSSVTFDEKDFCEILGLRLGVEKSFLEDKIIELPYTIDSTKFKTRGAKKHLLPVTQAFIRQYGVENIDYCKLLELAGGGIQVTLTIPVQNGSLQYTKVYNRKDIVKVEFHLAVVPFMTTSSLDLDYTLGIQDKRFYRTNEIEINCFKARAMIAKCDSVVRKSGDGNTIKSTYFKTKEFDAIKISCDSVSGFLIPIMFKSEANSQVSFAVDFGTTNTHIEYKKGSDAEKAFDIASDLPIWQSLIDRSAGETKEIADDNNFEKEIFPYKFNSSTDYRFPFRTAITYNKDINFNKEIDVFTHTNNFFLFEKLFYATYLELHTKLKWSNYRKREDKALVKSYIECLLYMVLYKTLLLNGKPKETKITWFYPVSMDSFEQGIFMEEWQNSYKKIFKVDNTNNIYAVPESIAPYLHYRGTQYAGACLSIDIGGGSSDIAVFENANDLPKFISSVKFAGNAIFGDGFPSGAFSNSTDNNGFVNAYRAKVGEVITKGSQKEIILADILEKRKDSADFSSFLFSLENEKDVKFNYTEELRANRRLKLPILVFFSSLIYYASNLIKKQNGTIPKNLLFSGTAAKTLKIIDAQRNFPNATNLFKHIISNVTEKTVDQLKIALADNPKEITCKGVLKAGIQDNISNCPILFWLGGTDSSDWGKVLNNKTDIAQTPLYSAIEDDLNKSSIENSLTQFFSLLDEYIGTVNLEGEYGIDYSAYEVFKSTRSSNIKDYIDQGAKAFFKSSDKHIEETLFFYPLIGILHSLALELSNSDN